MGIKSAIKALLPRHVRHRRVLLGPAAGSVLPIDFAHGTRLFLGIYERELWPHFRGLLGQGMRSFDIGGRDGYCALLINRLTKSDVVCFEADAAAIPGLQETFRRNSPRLTAVHALVGSGSREAGLTLDEASERFFFPDFIKIDVEGGELEVLMGGERTLARHPALIIEVHSDELERRCDGFLRARGYRVVSVSQSRFFGDPGRSIEHNRWIVCTRAA